MNRRQRLTGMVDQCSGRGKDGAAVAVRKSVGGRGGGGVACLVDSGDPNGFTVLIRDIVHPRGIKLGLQLGGIRRRINVTRFIDLSLKGRG